MTLMSQTFRIFLSYSRNDDETFVKCLYEDLTAHGFEVWWDRVSMPSRALTFLQEIRDAIDRCDRLILVAGPKAVQSDYIHAEWRYALSTCKIVTPILRIGDYDLLPEDLMNLHCLDMREIHPYDKALAKLLRVLSDPIQPLGALHNVPSLPAHFQSRPEYMGQLNNTVLADVNKPIVITSARQTTALQGMGGIGKSVLAAAFARACETRRAFKDGIIWLIVGQKPNLARNLRLIGMAFDDDLGKYVDFDSSRANIAKLLADKNCLLVLDDVWDVKHAEVFVNALGRQCKLLITTRNGELVTVLGAQEHRLDVLNKEDAIRLLADWSGQNIKALPLEAHSVIEECGNLPLAIAMCGAMVRDGTLMSDLLDALHEADLAFLRMQFPNYPYPDVLKALKVSVDALDDFDRKHYMQLAVFRPSEIIAEETVVLLWTFTSGVNERTARQLLIRLERKSLLRLEGKTLKLRVSLHDLQHDYLRASLGDLCDLHGELLKAYRQKCLDGWHTGPNDGYFFEHLAYHLVHAGQEEDLRLLLLGFDWMQAKLKATNIIELMADYDLAITSLSSNREVMLLVQWALRLSAYVLARDKMQLQSQLVGRLITQKSSEILTLLEQIRNWKGNTWLRPLTPTLTPPGGSLLCILTGHTGSVTAVAVTPEGRLAISGSHDNTLRVWDIRSGTELRILTGHTGGINAAVVTPDGRLAISGSYDKTLKVWDVESGTELRTLKGHNETVSAIAVMPDGRLAISGSHDKTLIVWDIEIGTELRTLEGHTDLVNTVVITPNGRFAISGSDDNTLKVWDIEIGTELRTLKGHTGNVIAVAITPDGRLALSGSGDKTLKVWDIKSGTELRTLKGHLGNVITVAITSDGKLAISGSDDNTLKVWDVESGTELRTLKGHSDWILTVAMTPDGRLAVSGSTDKTLKVWDIGGRVKMGAPTGHTAGVNAIAATPDGRFVISGSADKTLKVWDIKSGTELRTLEGHSGSVNAVAVTPDGRVAVSGSGSEDKTLKVWDIESGTELCTLKGHTGRIMAVVVTPDGRLAISGSEDKTLKVWDIKREIELRTLTGHTGIVWAIAVTPDSRLVISGSTDKIKVWDIESGTELRTIEGHTGSVNAIGVTPDGRRIISGSTDKTLKVWDIESGTELRTLTGHIDDINSVAVTTDCKLAISGSDDATLKVWDIESSQVIASLSVESGLGACAVAPDGMTIAAGDRLGNVHILHLEKIVICQPVITAWRSSMHNCSFGCPLCRTWSEIPASALGTEIPCPHCGKPIKLNPFTINADWQQVAKAWRGGKVQERC